VDGLVARWATRLSWVVAALVIVFGLANHFGWIDDFRGLQYARAVADSYDRSYGPGASQPIYSNNPAWPVLIRLIYKYSTADLPKDRTPVVIARDKAILSAVDQNIPGLPQWTAPGTPIALIYVQWPGQAVNPSDYRFIGSIADLHEWITRDSDDFRFLVSDVLLAVLALALAIITSIRTRDGR
jgi:hypothetical protein